GASVVSKINGSPLGNTTSASNGQVLGWNGTNWIPANAAPATTTNALSSAANIITSTVNGVAVTAQAVNSISNTSSTNSLLTTVNGVSSAAVNIVNSNTLGLSSGALTSTVNGVVSTAVNVLAAASNGLTATTGSVKLGGALTQATAINTSSTNTLSLGGLQTGTSTDSLLVVATGGVVKMIAAPAVFPQLLLDARRTTSYSPNGSYSTLVYNTTNVNVGSAYSTSTGLFTAPATGLYEIIINNNYSWGLLSSQQIGNQILVNNVVDMEKIISSYAASTTTGSSISGSTIVNITSGQTVKITVGAEIGTATPQVGTGQHVLKIIRLQ
ncbi:MAG: C1q-like domain-containing protein, partial [Ferruginibacter sp.]